MNIFGLLSVKYLEICTLVKGVSLNIFNNMFEAL